LSFHVSSSNTAMTMPVTPVHSGAR
jgi:hypothetical protein